MPAMDTVHQATFFLSAGEADAEARLSLTSLTAKIIETATEHANLLGIGNPAMQHLHAGWILSRITIGMDNYPEINSRYIIKTWILDFNRHFSTRCFSIEDSDGKIFGYARSIWLVLNYENHTNFGTSHLALPPEAIIGKDVPLNRQEKHITIIPENATSPTNKKILRANKPSCDYQFKYCDLDYYRHVNTVRYVALLMNQFSLKEHDTTMIERLELSFLHEASYGMQTRLLRFDNPENELHSTFQLTDLSCQEPLLFARINRKPIVI